MAIIVYILVNKHLYKNPVIVISCNAPVRLPYPIMDILHSVSTFKHSLTPSIQHHQHSSPYAGVINYLHLVNGCNLSK